MIQTCLDHYSICKEDCRKIVSFISLLPVQAVEGDSPPETIWTKTGNDGVSPTWTRAEVDIREASIFKKVVKVNGVEYLQNDPK